MFETAFVGFCGYMSTMDDTVDDRLFASHSEVQHSKIECKNVNNSFPLLVFHCFPIISLTSLYYSFVITFDLPSLGMFLLTSL